MDSNENRYGNYFVVLARCGARATADQPLRMAGKQERLNADRAEKFSAVRGDNLSSKRRNSADGADFAFVRNIHGIRIKVCCASCAWKVVTESW